MKYYVTIRDGQGRVSLALGPFPAYHEAFSRAPAVKGFCDNAYGEEAKDWIYGIDAKMAGPYPPGKLDGHLK